MQEYKEAMYGGSKPLPPPPPSPSPFSLSLPATPIAANFGLNADLQMQIWAPCKGSVLHIRIFTLFLGRFYVLKNMKFANYK